MYREIIVETTHEGADFVSDAFFALGVTGVTVKDPQDVKDVLSSTSNWDYVDESVTANPDAKVYVSGFVSAEETEHKIAEMNTALEEWEGVVDLGTRKITVREYHDVNWLEEWKKYYRPIVAGRFTVVPEWLSTDGYEDSVVIRIDPSMAFGTGEHESTRLCLTLLGELEVEGKRVIDVGTGSGILGIGAAKLNAKEIFMCDIDSLSIASAKENATLNGVLDKVEIKVSDLTEQANGEYDIALANLTADILLRLAGDLPRVLVKGGKLICSGIIHSRKEDVKAGLNAVGLKIVREIAMGEWDALLAVKE